MEAGAKAKVQREQEQFRDHDMAQGANTTAAGTARCAESLDYARISRNPSTARTTPPMHPATPMTVAI
ncbi:hypothetical protein EDF55_0941 [Curtobacterium sp. ZW137]|nr:hypothetical protein EDF55_0941 [Curtobacterium sp. ZW137]